MKILVINWQDIKNPFGGGAEVHLHEIFKRIAAMGNDVYLYCCKTEDLPEYEELDGIKIFRKGNRNTFNYTVKSEYLKHFSRENFDIIIDDINKIPFYTPKYVREPLLAISHHFFGTSIFRETNIISGLYVYLAEKIIDWVYKKTPFAVVSESTKEEFISRGFNPGNFSIIQNAINQAEFPMKICEKNQFPNIVFFGRIKKYKSIDHLLKAFSLIKYKIPSVSLYILGRGDYLPDLVKLARKLGISEQTKFFGYISNEDKIKLLSSAHVVVNTSLKEGWGITNIEANACGTPVVSANVPGLRDSVNPGFSGLLYEYGNINQLSDFLLDILRNDELRINLSIGALEWAKSFSWDDSAQLMHKRCIEVINNFHANC
jgi:glycosyltransferase involved in cell wall biosynthesis